MEIKISLVEDNLPLAGELEKWIARTKGFKCVGVHATGEAALEAIPGLSPDVVLVDLRLPGMSGVALIAKLKARCPEVQCLVLTMYGESDLIFEAFKAGACGYLLKRASPAELEDAIRQVFAGGSVMTPRIARRVLEIFVNPPSAKAASEEHRLNERERAVLQCMVEGQARKQVADSLGINVHTLDYVIRCIYRKLHVNCIAAAVSTAVRHGIVANQNDAPSRRTSRLS
ncbi:Two component transcriptional regulator, LuxR family [Verrucomicrobia bacterium]|nr:Two component transcriptional regulator, LuxR family [Verrucomicrobiota bacterium]